jgi:hypothetical protein
VTLLFWILRLLVLLLIVRFVVTMIRQAALYSKGGPKPAAGRSKRQPERIGGTLVQDPQCGTYLPKERAIARSISVRTSAATHGRRTPPASSGPPP